VESRYVKISFMRVEHRPDLPPFREGEEGVYAICVEHFAVPAYHGVLGVGVPIR
jgi:hypothetical protein